MMYKYEFERVLSSSQILGKSTLPKIPPWMWLQLMTENVLAAAAAVKLVVCNQTSCDDVMTNGPTYSQTYEKAQLWKVIL